MVKWKRDGSIAGGAIVLILVLVNTLYVSDYRDILKENPGRDLFLLDFVNRTPERLEFLARGHGPTYDFYRYKYERNKINIYFQSDWVGEAYWQVFEGRTGMFWRDIHPLTYTYDRKNDRATVVMNITYYKNSRKTVAAGNLVRYIEVYPNLNKEIAVFCPIARSKYRTGYNLKYVFKTDLNYTRNIDLDAEEKWRITNRKGLSFNMGPAKQFISAARLYKNGKIEIRFKSSPRCQVIDPSLENLEIGMKLDFNESNVGAGKPYKLWRKREVIGFEPVWEEERWVEEICSKAVSNFTGQNITVCHNVTMVNRTINPELNGDAIFRNLRLDKLEVDGKDFVFNNSGCWACGDYVACLSDKDGYSEFRGDEFKCNGSGYPIIRPGESGWIKNISTERKDFEQFSSGVRI